MPGKLFIDTNVWIYLLLQPQHPADVAKRDKAKYLLEQHSHLVVSNQVIHEIANVLLKKYHIEITQVERNVKEILNVVELYLLSDHTVFVALQLLHHYKLSFYDALIVAAALETQCQFLYSEDLQAGQEIEGRLKIINPFSE